MHVDRQRRCTWRQTDGRDAGAPARSCPERIFEGRGDIGSVLAELGVAERLAAGIHCAGEDLHIVGAGPTLRRQVWHHLRLLVKLHVVRESFQAERHYCTGRHCKLHSAPVILLHHRRR